MVLGYTSLFLLIAVFVFWINKSPFFTYGSLPKMYSYFAFTLKVLSGVAVWLIYTYYYTTRIDADIYKYFDDAAHLFKSTQNDWILRLKLISGFQNDLEIKSILAGTNFWDSGSELFFNDNRTMIRIHLALWYLSGGVYLFHLFFFSLISFIGTSALFHFFNRNVNLPNWILFICCFYIPSVLFWASAPLKESLILFGLGALLYGIQGVKERENYRLIIWLTVGLLTLLSSKIYILFTLLPGLWFWSTTAGKTKRAIQVKFLWTHFLLALFLFSDKVIYAIAKKQLQFKTLIAKNGVNSAIDIGTFDTPLSLFSTLPQALFNVLIRPAYPVNLNPFSLFAAAEHVIFLALFIVPFIYKKRLQEKEQRLALFCISFVVVGSCIIGLTIPVIGGIVRYKVPFILFYLIGILTFTNFSKIAPKLK
tara:strand:+ start:63020 stop:64285 length:1266 start_codon:yes stop_codon:yes gene_type:complete